MKLAEEIERLHGLHQSGALSDAEYAQAKAKLLAAERSDGEAAPGAVQSFNRFRRSRSDRWLGGICGGLGQYTELDSWVWRLLFVFFALCFGTGVLAYLLAWIFIPEQE
ncbi:MULTISPECIES: PspC domain-containing protein [unclassified Undibacterium]|uniref:PspC domain-containing protein n=1 Tax=unclassified Undibacterium TaxID=2630295 RepID=UPI002AC8D227|nr:MULTISPECIES: PspC domain-containing protein [unclassified Undibacterium]MEB0140304.1 PspC domain-containing protein [Undibacterium sp. CCC2.1]MEB0173573.1 PspC domain-containing protein [Undibacterium sp. CCC1.1]MEB0177212.1 PspC domain-containing protein [Undibacterium sp. CCC3.4]MEB0216477.1 PspC domain-containing protein [Undibacterium sp. 5I2]WPX43247.1 PspC domain-containing protein [Undibacterium sp. CCC3.4]